MNTFTLVQLYPDELGVAGDRGNVLAVTARLAAAGLDCDVIEVHHGDALPASADIVIIGGGPLSALRRIHADLLAHGDTLRSWAADGVVFFAYGTGAEVLGRGIHSVEGERIEGVGIFPLAVRRVQARKVGYVIAEVQGERIVGFEDNASEWTLDVGATPFARVTTSSSGTGSQAAAGSDGVRLGSSVATLLGGPLLPLNPCVTLALIESAVIRRGEQFSPPAAGELDRYAARARAVMEQNSTHVFSRI